MIRFSGSKKDGDARSTPGHETGRRDEDGRRELQVVTPRGRGGGSATRLAELLRARLDERRHGADGPVVFPTPEDIAEDSVGGRIRRGDLSYEVRREGVGE